MAERILIVDDDKELLDLMHQALQGEGFSIFMAESGERGLAIFDQVAPDVMILDIMMPGMDGWEVCRRLRQASPVPIIFLTALGSTENTVQGLMGGADDYLVKPFKVAELRARVRAVLRRARMTTQQLDVLRFGNGDLILNRAEQKAFAYGREVRLAPVEYNLLLFMAERAGRILPARLLFDAIWGPYAETDPQSVKWHIWRLRQKIEATPREPRFILTERGKGYRFSPR